MENNRMGEFLAALRKSKGYTQQEVADTLGVSNKTVSSWETGASCPDISMLPVLAELYGVTCDELIRGKRLSSEEQPSPAGRKKATERLLQRQKTNLFTLSWIAGGLAGLAFLLTSIVGYAALRSLLAFFLGLIFHAASVITAVICIRRFRFRAGDPWESEPALRFSLSLNKALFWLVFANIAVFGFDLPHSFVPAKAGLLFEGETLLLQLLFALGAAALTFLIGRPVLLRVQKKRLLAAVDRASDEQSGAFTALMRQNTLSIWRTKPEHAVCLEDKAHPAPHRPALFCPSGAFSDLPRHPRVKRGGRRTAIDIHLHAQRRGISQARRRLRTGGIHPRLRRAAPKRE